MDISRSEYLVSGEITPERWELAFRYLDSLGVTVVPLSDEASSDQNSVLSPSNPESAPVSPIPSSLSDLKSDKQFIGIEHLYEFWLVYRKRPNLTASYKVRDACVDRALWSLIKFQPEQFRRDPELYDDQVSFTRFREEAGLVVLNRKELGFPPLNPGEKYEVPFKTFVIQAQGLVDYVQGYEELPYHKKIYGLRPQVMAFLHAFAEYIQPQITTADDEATASTSS